MGKRISGAFVEDQRKKPFAAVSVDLIDRFGPLIGKGHGLAVYLVLARYASNKTHEALLWNRTIAKKLGVSKPTVKRALDLLIQYHLVQFESGQKEGQANRYILRDLPELKPRGSTPLFDREDELAGSPVNHPPSSGDSVNQPSTTYEPESDGWITGEPGVEHGRSRGSSPAVQGWVKNEGGGSSKTEGGVVQICDRNKGTSRLIQSTRETNPETQTENRLAQVREVASLYPKIRDPFNLTMEDRLAIAAAIKRHDYARVWAGTKSLFDAAAHWPRDKIQFLPTAVKFFNRSEYLTDPAEWDRNNQSSVKGGVHDTRSDLSKYTV